jgi:catechol 2,3-dioxygenase-like lactoylglutathione lyase family enzyme
MLQDAKMIGFIGISDSDKARAFYSGVLGLTVTHEDDLAIAFDSNGVTLRCAKVPEVVTAPYTTAGWLVEEIERKAAALNAAGVETIRYESMEQDNLGIWPTPDGAKICWFNDPDGNNLSLTQAP